MYEDYYSHITDIEAVFSRIGLSGLYPGSFKPDLPHLSGLIHAFQTHIPFEDLDSSLLGESIRLDIPGLFDKLILRRRGGFCFELNGFLNSCCGISDMIVFPYSAALSAGGTTSRPALTGASL